MLVSFKIGSGSLPLSVSFSTEDYMHSALHNAHLFTFRELPLHYCIVSKFIDGACSSLAHVCSRAKVGRPLPFCS